MQTGGFQVPAYFPATVEERDILQRWGAVFDALDTASREPETDRQRLFVDEVRGTIYPVSVSAKLWLRYKEWKQRSEEQQARAAQEVAMKRSERERAAVAEEAERHSRMKERAVSELQVHLSRVDDDVEYRRWLAEHKFDDFR